MAAAPSGLMVCLGIGLFISQELRATTEGPQRRGEAFCACIRLGYL